MKAVWMNSTFRAGMVRIQGKHVTVQMACDVPCGMARWIGIDYGGVRTGLAFTDPAGAIAFPHKTVPRGVDAGNQGPGE